MGSIRARKDNNMLFIDFRYQGVRCREQTALVESESNRKRLEKALSKIEAEIDAGVFNYRNHFSSSKNAQKFDCGGMSPIESKASSTTNGKAVNVPEQTNNTPLFRDFAETWFTEKEVEWRKSHRISTRADLDKVLIPRFGDKVVGQITKADILGFRAELSKVNARGKTTALSPRRINKIFGPLRQILNEAADRFDFRTPFHNIKQLRC